jgi:prophage tail gpP-like protein
VTDLTLELNGARYKGWKTVSVKRSLEELAASFELELADHWFEGMEPIPINEGDACALYVGKEPILTGWVDEALPSYWGRNTKLSVNGRSLAGDLVDCAAIHKGGEWSKATIDRIASDLVKGFNAPNGIRITSDGADISRPIHFALGDGESVSTALERACRLLGVLLTSDGNGTLVFAKPGAETTQTLLTDGGRILGAERVSSQKERYSDYFVKAHAKATAIDRLFDVKAASFEGHAKDPAVKRYRPVVVMSDDTVQLSAQRRAEWQRDVRAGRADRVRYTIAGWHTDEQKVWSPNLLVPVVDARLNIDQWMLCVEATLTLGREGKRTELELCDPRAFEVEVPEGRRKPRSHNAHAKPGKA